MRTTPHASPSLCLFLVAAPVVALTSAGCSQDPSAAPISTASLGDRPPATEPPPRPTYQWNGNPSRIETGSVAPAAAPQPRPPLNWQASPRAPAPPTARPGSTALAPGEIEVQPGETLYGLSKRHGVPVNAFVDANKLASIDLKAGQRLRLPRGAR